MKVKELIEMLQNVNQDKDVFVYLDDPSTCQIPVSVKEDEIDVFIDADRWKPSPKLAKLIRENLR